MIDRRRGALLVGLVLLGASAGCDRGTKAKAASPPPLPDVVVAQVEQRPVSIVRDFTARTEAGLVADGVGHPQRPRAERC